MGMLGDEEVRRRRMAYLHTLIVHAMEGVLDGETKEEAGNRARPALDYAMECGMLTWDEGREIFVPLPESFKLLSSAIRQSIGDAQVICGWLWGVCQPQS